MSVLKGVYVVQVGCQKRLPPAVAGLKRKRAKANGAAFQDESSKYNPEGQRCFPQAFENS